MPECQRTDLASVQIHSLKSMLLQPHAGDDGAAHATLPMSPILEVDAPVEPEVPVGMVTARSTDVAPSAASQPFVPPTLPPSLHRDD